MSRISPSRHWAAASRPPSFSPFRLIVPPPARQRTFGGTSFVSLEGDLSALPELVAMQMDAARESLWSAETAEASYALAASSLGPDLLGYLIEPYSERTRSGIPA
jgi:hypothetical protein